MLGVKIKTSKLKIPIAGLWVFAALLTLVLMGRAGISAFDPSKIVGALVYDLLVLIPLLVIGVLNTVRCCRNGTKKQTILLTWLALGVVWLVAVWFANYESDDMFDCLLPWSENYQNKSLAGALHDITTVSNYTPFYNYFLILFSHLFSLQGCLYAIKYLTFVFSIALAVAMELIVCHLRNTKFNYLHLALFLFLPPVLLEFTAWGQCDAIYTTFCLFAFYWALKHRSVPCFINLGLAFAFKLQFLFIAPIIFVMLIIRDNDGKKYLSWKWVWLAPLMYVVNLVPLCFGDSFIDLLLIYFRQTGENLSFSMNCANLGYLLNVLVLLNPLSMVKNMIAFNLFMVLLSFIGIAITLTLLVLVFRANRRKTLTPTDLLRYAVCFALVMVYFMPKMHDRFYFIAMVLAVLYALVEPSRKNALIATLITVALTLPMFGYLLNLPAELDWIKMIAVYLGIALNTGAGFLLLLPIICEETGVEEHHG